MYESDLFLKRIMEQPEDDAPRLVFADWLEEQGDPRGEFIRLQCALAKGHDSALQQKLRQREQSLRQLHGKAWTKPYSGIAERCTFRRGFVEGITLSAEKYLKHADELFDWAPLRKIRLTELSATAVDALAAEPSLSRIVELDLTANDLQDAGLERLMRSPHWRKLRSLNVSVNGLTDRGLACIANSEAARSLARLDLSHNHIRSPRTCAQFGQLTDLDLSHNECSAEAILATPGPKLVRLKITSNPIGDEQSPSIVHKLFDLVAAGGNLDLGDCGLGTVFIAALAATPNRSRLTALKLDGNAIGDEGLIALSRTANFDRLTQLNLAANGITDRGALALSRSGLFPQLRHIDLRQNQLSREGIDALWSSDRRHSNSVLLFADNLPPQPLENSLAPDAALPIAEEFEADS